jgi:predicted dehydrogenase
MKQILQSLKTGEIEIAEIPCPQVRAGCLLVKTHASLVSSGTERMLLEFGQANWLEKIRKQPDKVRQVLNKIKTDGLLPTLDAVKSKLDTPLPIGYSNVGEVIGVGENVRGFKVGDRVLSNGYHAEVVCVPKNLCVRVPENISAEVASFGVLGSIALEGIRLAKPELGETVAVFGLGVIGLLLVQLLRAQGCRVIGIDFDAQKLELAKQFGAEVVDLAKKEDPIIKAKQFSRESGIDAVLIAAANSSNDIVHQAAQMSRKRGRIVLVGVVGLELSRADFYEKELTFQVSCSYGPGRYDKFYEEGGHDYPVGYVRWTEQRNFEAVLDLMADGRIDPTPLISHRFELDLAKEAYSLLTGNAEPSIGIVINYAKDSSVASPNKVLENTIVKDVSGVISITKGSDRVNVGFIGAGNYASRVLIPAFKKAGVNFVSVASSAGLSATHVARKFGFAQTTTDVDVVINDPNIDLVVIATQHDTHADLVCRVLQAGKKVFVEKPLAIDKEQLSDIIKTYDVSDNKFLMVGFNRRFAPQIQKIKALLNTVSVAKSFVMTVNAGEIPPDHWTQDLKKGGGRIVGEACHMVDLLRFLSGSEIHSFKVSAVGQSKGKDVKTDEVAITLNFVDGSIGTIHYLSSGHKSFPKERLEIFCAGRVLQLDNFRKLRAFGWPGFKKMNLWKQDKGQDACVAATVAALKKGEVAPISFGELVEIAKVSVDVMNLV